MDIIIDTREQKPLTFTGHKTFRRKLEEGDYNTTELEPYLTLERKSLADLYGSITSDHQRFKREILRSRDKGKKMYIFIEGTLEDFYYFKWATRKYTITPQTLRKIINTMKERYDLTFVECTSRKQMSRLIVQTLELQKINKNNEVNENDRCNTSNGK